MPGRRATPWAPPASLAVVLVSWEDFEELVACLASLAEHRPRRDTLPVEVCVVDNASQVFDEVTLRRLWPEATIVRNPTNRGFGPAANQGVARCTSDIVLLLNPDARPTPGALEALVSAFHARPDAVAVAPRLVDGPGTGGEPQARFQLRRLPTWRQAVRELLLVDKLFPDSEVLRRERYLHVDRTRPFAVEQPAAAALAVRREVFLAARGFDERFVPAWFEDVDLCRRLLDFGPILFWPDAVFVHGGGHAASHLGYHRFLPLYYRNECRYWRKYGGFPAELAFRTLLLVGMALRLAVLPLRPVVPRPRGQAALAYLRTALMALGVPPRPPAP